MINPLPVPIHSVVGAQSAKAQSAKAQSAKAKSVKAQSVDRCARPRPRVSRRGLVFAGLAAGATRAFAAEQLSIDNLYVNDRLDEACGRAIDFLLNNQRENGSITDRGHAVALTSLSIMALAALGVEPSEDSRRGRTMRTALNFVLDERHQTKAGYLGAHDGSRMYGHGITTLMLTEMLGMGATEEQNTQIHERLKAALRLSLIHI